MIIFFIFATLGSSSSDSRVAVYINRLLKVKGCKFKCYLEHIL